MEVVASDRSEVETETEILNVVDPLAGVRWVLIRTDCPGAKGSANC